MYISENPRALEDNLEKEIICDSGASIAISQLLKYMPHRFPFLMIDKVIGYKKGNYLHAVKLVSASEPYFQWYGSGHIAMPNMMILESMAQASGLLALLTDDSPINRSNMFYLLGFKQARFYTPAEPADRLQVTVELIYHKSRIWRFNGDVSNDKGLIANAVVTCAQDGKSKSKTNLNAENNKIITFLERVFKYAPSKRVNSE
jgi:3-hydroxyacyl-[acyl-carrier-protein] dehydratase